MSGLSILIFAATASAASNGETRERPAAAAELTAQQAMLWKYVARCALRPDQTLEAGGGAASAKASFRGAIGLAPEWKDGSCTGACQERVSSCLAALTNQTGLHVNVSLTSAAVGLESLAPNDAELAYPYQEGAFFGNVFAGEAFVCRGRDAEKGIQVKRICALAPELCTGIATFVDAGPCERSCEMACSRLSNGSTRCAAVRCRDPRGRTWEHPITTHLRDRIEAVNADDVRGANRVDSALRDMRTGGRAVYRAVDFGSGSDRRRAFVANLTALTGGGRIEIWSHGRRLGAVGVRDTRGVAADVIAPIRNAGLAGAQDVELRFLGIGADARLNEIGLR